MKGTWAWILAAAFGVGLIAGRAALAVTDEKPADKTEKVTLDQLPAPVKATVAKEAGKNELSKLEKQTKDGKVTYVACWSYDCQDFTLTVAEDGTVVKKDSRETPKKT